MDEELKIEVLKEPEKEPEKEPLVGLAIDYKENYEKIRELGRGKFGIVYAVKSKKSQKTFAAKHVRARKLDVRDKIHLEIEILHELDHPKIIKFVSAFENASEIIFLTEYLSGGELFERVASEDFNLTEAECVQFMRQICEGVQYLHKKTIVHLDLKPENIVCCQPDSNNVKLIDFGLARRIKPNEQIKVLCGTAEFISPEVVNYDPVSLASDMWALGVIAYVLLSGLSPFMGDNVAETYSNVLNAEFDFDDPEFDEISVDAKDFISKLLVKPQHGRLTADQSLEHSWLQTSQTAMTKKINKRNLRKFLARRRWQKCGQAIRAMKRMSGLLLKRRSTLSLSTESLEDDSDPSRSGAPSELESRSRRASCIETTIEETSSITSTSPVPPPLVEQIEEGGGVGGVEGGGEEGGGGEAGGEAQFVIAQTYTSTITLEIDGN